MRKLLFCLSTVLILCSITVVPALASEAFTVNATTGIATAQEGTTTYTARGGTGTVTFDLKNGWVQFRGVPLTTSSIMQVTYVSFTYPASAASKSLPAAHYCSFPTPGRNGGGKVPLGFVSYNPKSSITVDVMTHQWYKAGSSNYYSYSFGGTPSVPTTVRVYGLGVEQSTVGNKLTFLTDTGLNLLGVTGRKVYYISNTVTRPQAYSELTMVPRSPVSLQAYTFSYYNRYKPGVPGPFYIDYNSGQVDSEDGSYSWSMSKTKQSVNPTKTTMKWDFNYSYSDIRWDIGADVEYGVGEYAGITFSGSALSSSSRTISVIDTQSTPVYTPKTVQVPVCDPVVGAATIKKVTFNNCITNNVTLDSNFAPGVVPLNVSGAEVIIDGGTYKGSPAISGNNVTVKRGTITDLRGNSQFLVDADSECTVTTSGTQTISTVKLSNPPVIIDWEDFPGIDLDIDLAAPVIEVIRNPADSRAPTNQVVLTIKATDPNGNDDPKPISVNGGAFVASPYQYTVRENQTVQITARDANGNTRDYNCTINNIDTQKPEIVSFQQSNEAWTKDRVKVTVNATDDVKLHPDGAYRYRYTPNSTGVTSAWSGWTVDRTYFASENGTLEVQVRDALGKQTSDSYKVGNIDTVAPTFTATLSPPAGTLANKNTGVTIELTLVNTGDKVTGEASPMSSTAVKWDPSEPWSDDLTRTVYENGTYNIQVRDSCGNVSAVQPVTVNNVSTAMPVIDSFTGDHLRAPFVTAPATLKVTAHASSGSLATRPYSWDGGKTWTSISEFKAYYNGEYEVTVKDATGNMTSATLIVSNIDAVAPTAAVYLYKGIPADWDPVADGAAEIGDYVWKIRVEAEDNAGGSGIDMIQTLWDGGTYSNPTAITLDVEEAGVYGIVVTDKAGNRTYAEKIVTNESIGNPNGSNGNDGAYVGIAIPSGGSAGSPFNGDGTSIGDLVWSKDGVYKRPSGPRKPYEPGKEGINVNLIAQAKRGNWLSGYATFDGVKYPITFGGRPGPVKVTERDGTPAEVFIPISGITKDISNGRLVTVFQEWGDEQMTDLEREGSSTLYTSTQVSDPNIQWTYDKANDEMVIVANSAVAGMPAGEPKYSLDGGATWQDYTGPFSVGSASEVIIRATDNAGNQTELRLDASTLAVSGGGGGGLPTGGVDGSIGADGGPVNSYYISGRTAEAYIIGGPRSNTNNIPSSEVFDTIVN